MQGLGSPAGNAGLGQGQCLDTLGSAGRQAGPGGGHYEALRGLGWERRNSSEEPGDQ